MKCIVFVKFLPGGSVTPDQFFSHLNARWGWYDENNRSPEVSGNEEPELNQQSRVKSAVCLTDYDSIQQLAIDISIMPGAGIEGIEVIPVSDATEENEVLSSMIESMQFRNLSVN